MINILIYDFQQEFVHKYPFLLSIQLNSAQKSVIISL